MSLQQLGCVLILFVMWHLRSGCLGRRWFRLFSLFYFDSDFYCVDEYCYILRILFGSEIDCSSLAETGGFFSGFKCIFIILVDSFL